MLQSCTGTKIALLRSETLVENSLAVPVVSAFDKLLRYPFVFLLINTVFCAFVPNIFPLPCYFCKASCMHQKNFPQLLDTMPILSVNVYSSPYHPHPNYLLLNGSAREPLTRMGPKTDYTIFDALHTDSS